MARARFGRHALVAGTDDFCFVLLLVTVMNSYASGSHEWYSKDQQENDGQNHAQSF